MRNVIILVVAAALLTGCANYGRNAAARQANPAPCPNVFVLSDAARFIDFGEAEPSLEAVAFSGEFENVETRCRYYADVPIQAEVDVTFAIGRGPAAVGQTYDVRYFVAVTRTNRDVIAKQEFSTPVTFKEGRNVVRISQSINDIMITRKGSETSGVNFEIAVGFVLDRDQVLYNRSGKSLKFPEA
ncbi:MAG: hypothetical protein AAF830_14635 [Pseudomonadota bacterium]